jgi:nucleotide-binding universal stress UspA family protein
MIADLLAILDLGRGDDDFLAQARRFAEAHHAALRVCVAAPVPSLDYALAMEGGYALADELAGGARDKARRLPAGDETADIVSLGGEPGELLTALARLARAADLALVGPPAAFGEPGFRRRAAEALALSSGRPALLLPATGVADRFRHVVIGWNGSREAVRALNDTLPLLDPDTRIDVVAAGKAATESGLDDICAHLRRRGHRVAAHRLDGKGEASDLLLRFGRHAGADLLAVGAYSRSRVSEVILGGVTRDLLDGAGLPILLSH